MREFNTQVQENLNATWNVTWNSVSTANIIGSYRVANLSLTEPTAPGPWVSIFLGEKAFYCSITLSQ